jgi:regulator of RNase E activity RraA
MKTVFASCTPRPSHRQDECTVQCGGIEVRPGNYVVDDEDRIAVGPKTLLRK